MNGPTWFLIGLAAGIAGTAFAWLAHALTTALRNASTNLRTAITEALDNPPDLDDDHVDDDVWDRDLRNLITDSID